MAVIASVARQSHDVLLRRVLDQVALGADELLGGSEETALLIDESVITKKG